MRGACGRGVALHRVQFRQGGLYPRSQAGKVSLRNAYLLFPVSVARSVEVDGHEVMPGLEMGKEGGGGRLNVAEHRSDFGRIVL